MRRCPWRSDCQTFTQSTTLFANNRIDTTSVCVTPFPSPPLLPPQVAPESPFLGIQPVTINDTRILISGFWGFSRHINYLGEILQVRACACACACSCGAPLSPLASACVPACVQPSLSLAAVVTMSRLPPFQPRFAGAGAGTAGLPHHRLVPPPAVPALLRGPPLSAPSRGWCGASGTCLPGQDARGR